MVGIRLDSGLAGRLVSVAESLYPSPSMNRLAEEMISQMLDLIEAKEADRRVPPIVAMVDAGRRVRAFQQSFAPANKLESLAQSAIDQAVAEVKSGRQGPAEAKPKPVSQARKGQNSPT